MTLLAWLSAALLVPYATWFGSPKNDCIDETLMIRAADVAPAVVFRARVGASAEVNCSTERRLTLSTLSNLAEEETNTKSK